jgi:cell division control protein 6
LVFEVYGSKLNASLSTGSGGIPTQQKILLACLLLMLKKGRTKEVTMGKLFVTYSKVRGKQFTVTYYRYIH